MTGRWASGRLPSAPEVVFIAGMGKGSSNHAVAIFSGLPHQLTLRPVTQSIFYQRAGQMQKGLGWEEW
jgi:hypothetical protein